MKNKDYIKHISAGIFLVGGLCLLVVFILTLGKNKGITEDKFQMSAAFQNIGGLSEGAPVYLAGVTVGGVESIGFLKKPVDGRRVLVMLNIYEKFRDQVEHPLEVVIQTEGVLGEKVVQIYVVSEDRRTIDIQKPIIGTDPLDVSTLAEAFSEAADSFTKTATEMSQINMVELSDTMLDSSRALLITSEGINEIMEELQEITFKSKRLFDRIEQKLIDGELFKVF